MTRLTRHYISPLSVEECRARLAELPTLPNRTVRVGAPQLYCILRGSTQYELEWSASLNVSGSPLSLRSRGASRGLYWGAGIDMQPVRTGTLISMRLRARRYLGFGIAIYGVMWFLLLSLGFWLNGTSLTESVGPAILVVALNVASIILISLGYGIWINYGEKTFGPIIAYVLDARPAPDPEVAAPYVE